MSSSNPKADLKRFDEKVNKFVSHHFSL